MFYVVEGPYCDLMKEDAPRLSSLVKKLRWKYDSSVLEIGDVKMAAEAPLCEVFFAGPFPGTCRIFYARGATLQVGRLAVYVVHASTSTP